MTILTTSTDPQHINFQGRYLTADLIIITDEETKESVEINITTSIVDFYTQATGSFELIDGHSYRMEVITIISTERYTCFIDNMFCTDQVISEYSINNNKYTEKSVDKKYKIYE